MVILDLYSSSRYSGIQFSHSIDVNCCDPKMICYIQFILRTFLLLKKKTSSLSRGIFDPLKQIRIYQKVSIHILKNMVGQKKLRFLC